jgi:hypothetical protein
MEDLGLSPTREEGALTVGRARRATDSWVRSSANSAPVTQASPQGQSSVAASFAEIAEAHRKLYWVADPAVLHGAVVENVRLGQRLLPGMVGAARSVLAHALAESSLLAGRIEFFDLGQRDTASEPLVRALQFAGKAEDFLLGAAILGHTAFVPGWAGDRDGASDRLMAARTYARRAEAPGLLWAWLDCVDAECATLCGDIKDALALISRAESQLIEAEAQPAVAWMDWFSLVRLAAFKGNVELKAGHFKRAETSLLRAHAEIPSAETKQRAIISADLAAAKVGQNDYESCCGHLHHALDDLSLQWYATAMDRIRDVRRSLRPWQDERCVRELDERLYDWTNTVNTLRE